MKKVKKRLFFLFFMLLFGQVLGQGLYLTEGTNGPMLRVLMGESKWGGIQNFQAGYSYHGKWDGILAYNTAVYDGDGLERNFWTIGLEYHLIKPVLEGEYALDFISRFNYGKFRGDGTYTDDWDNTAKEIVIGGRFGNRLLETKGFFFLPSVELLYFWRIKKFEDKIYDIIREETINGGRIIINFDTIWVFENDLNFQFNPVLQFHEDAFVYALEVGFVWGKVQYIWMLFFPVIIWMWKL